MDTRVDGYLLDTCVKEAKGVDEKDYQRLKHTQEILKRGLILTDSEVKKVIEVMRKYV